jgi:hypothetical protein
MSLFRRSDIWWYEFWFAGRRIQESGKSPSKTIARTAEQKRRRELEQGFNNFTDVRHERIRTFSEVADEFFNGYKLDPAVSGDTQHFEGESLQKSLQCNDFGSHRAVSRGRKLLKQFGSSGRTRTYNPSVNSRMLCH